MYFYKRVAIFLLALAILFFGLIAYMVWWIESSMSAVEAHLAAHQSELPDAVNRLLRETPRGEQLKGDEIPAPLRTEEVRWARRNEDHIELAVSRNPDTTMGFRVWPSKQDEFHQDKPTEIPGVYRFSYCNDVPESPANRPD